MDVIDKAPVVLGQRQVFILPTRHGLLFSLVLCALLLASVNYNNGLGYLLTFLLASMVIVSTLDTQRNLLRLRITPGACPPVYAGDPAHFDICLHNDGRAPRRALCLEYNKQVVARADVGAHQSQCLPLLVPTLRRGWLACPTRGFYRLSLGPAACLVVSYTPSAALPGVSDAALVARFIESVPIP